jgi:multidrug resistance efflux pump
LPQIPKLRRQTTFRAAGNGLFEVVHPEINERFEVNEQGRFLLEMMDGRNSQSDIRESYERRFDGSISRDQLHEVIELWSVRGLLENSSLPSLENLPVASPRPETKLGESLSHSVSAVTSDTSASAQSPTEKSSKSWTARKIALITLLVVVLAALFIPVNDRVTGSFRVRPATRLEVSVAEAGFLQDIALEEGTRVHPGTPLAKIYIPDLAVNITKKQAEIQESAAHLKRLRVGARPEEVEEQTKRVERDTRWRDLAEQDLQRSKQSLAEELIQIDNQIAQAETEFKYAEQAATHSQSLYDQKALSGEQYLAERTRADLAKLRLEEVKARRAERQALGTIEAESELARRSKELADEASKLMLLKAGSRPEDIEAEQARLDRLNEELRYLQEMEKRTVVVSPVEGLITTPRMKEKNGQYVMRGAVLCVVEELSELYAEISIREDMEHGVRPGQPIQLRARSLPYQTFDSVVDRKAPSAIVAPGQTQGTVTVYCKLNEESAGVLTGMTGYARVYRGYRPLGLIFLDRFRRYLRTEFWF